VIPNVREERVKIGERFELCITFSFTPGFSPVTERGEIPGEPF
jgi:hypothetical protein